MLQARNCRKGETAHTFHTLMTRRGWLAVLFALACGIGPVRAAGVLNVGLVPAEDPRVVVSDNQALLDHLRNSLQMEVKPFVATDYNGVIEALRAKKLDVAFLGPFSYVLASTVADVEAFAVLETEKQGASYRSVIIARKDHNIGSLKDLGGKTFAFVDPSSTSGHLFPKAGLIKAGYDPDRFFSRVIFSGGHDASAIAVQNGKVDAAAVADALLETAFKRGMLKQDRHRRRLDFGADPGCALRLPARSAGGSQGEAARPPCSRSMTCPGARTSSSSAGSRSVMPLMTWCATPPSCSTST